MVTGAPFLRVVKRLRTLVQQWWGLEMAFVDAHGKLHITDEPRPAPVCSTLHQTRPGVIRCLREELTFTREARAQGAEGIVSQTCHAGLRRLYVPIHVEGEFVGAILIAGYRANFPDGAEWARIVTALARLGLDEATAASIYERARVLDARDEGYLKSLLQLVSDEIAGYEQELITLNRSHRQTAAAADPFAEIVGRSPAIRRVLQLVSGVAASDATILITGESGTGKERVARALHARSARAQHAFVALNCGALQDQLLESELFGHVRGSFTGAVRDKAGLIRQADGGTLLLDEVGEMSLAMQVKLLRVLQEGVYYPVGGTTPETVDVRIVAATHRNLEAMVKEGGFREDLYYRLNVIRVDVPPLRERRDDVPLLVEHFLAKRSAGGAAKRLHPAALQALMRYPWPGNVRELENELARLWVLAGGADVIAPALLSERIREPLAAANDATGTLDEAVEALEKRLIGEGLRRTNWNKSLLARELGMSRTSLIQKIERYGLERRRKPRKAA